MRLPRVGDNSPWGRIDQVYRLGERCVSVSTPGHGGVWVPDDMLATMPAELRCNRYGGGANWFEEDVEWALVALAFPGEFKAKDGLDVAARNTVKHFADTYPTAAAWLEQQGGAR